MPVLIRLRLFLAHTLGNPFEVLELSKFCKENNIWLIEDNCDALGSTYNNKLTGTFGDISTLSFYPAHHITMGEGGAVLTSSTKLKLQIDSFRDWGRDCWCQSGHDNTCNKRYDWQLGDLPYGYDHKFTYSNIGYNLKATDLQASIGLAQLDKLDGFIEKRKSNWKKVNNYISSKKNILSPIKQLQDLNLVGLDMQLLLEQINFLEMILYNTLMNIESRQG